MARSPCCAASRRTSCASARTPRSSGRSVSTVGSSTDSCCRRSPVEESAAREFPSPAGVPAGQSWRELRRCVHEGGMSVTDVTADVAVVGGGPAGAVTALLLARAGVDVAVVERRPMPRPKPCGDCLSARAAHLLERLGLMDAVLATRPARLRGWRIFSPAGHSFESRFADVCGGDARLETAFAVPRDRLDAVLLDAAVAAGARVLTPVHVHTVTADNV